MRKPNENLALMGYNDIFNVGSSGDVITEIPLIELHEPDAHPFQLYDESKRLFRGFAENMADDTEDDMERYCVEIDKEATRHLRNVRNIADKLYEQVASEPVDERYLYRKSQLLWEINQIREQSAVFALHREHICWLEQPSDGVFALCSMVCVTNIISQPIRENNTSLLITDVYGIASCGAAAKTPKSPASKQ